MAQPALHEVSRCKIQINKGDVPSFTWEKSVLTVQTEKNVSIFKFSHNVQCIDKKIDWVITDIPCPKTSPATSLFSRKFMKQNIDNIEYTQMMLDSALWPHNVQLMEEMASVVSFQWSPPNFVHNNESVIAVLNNVGNIELFGPTSCGYSSFLNLSSKIEDKFKEKSEGRTPKNVEEAKIAADTVETSAFCWGTQHNDVFNFVTAQKNGDIHFWQLTSNIKGINVEELMVQHSNEGEIIIMKWIPISQDIFMLLLTNIFGQLHVYKYQWINNSLILVNCDCPWPHKDRMVIKHLKYIIVDDKVIIICNKHRHLLILLVDENCNKLAEYLNNLNDYKITVISQCNDEFYIGMINCQIFKINVIIKNSNLVVSKEKVAIKENFANHDLCGLQFSQNDVLCALGVVNRRLLYRKENVSLDMIFLTQEESHEKEMSLLLDNPTKILTDYWDCIEIVRCKAMKLKILPFIDFNRLYSNSSTIYELKLYRILLTYYHSLESILKNKSKGWLPETSQDAVRDRILALNASSIVVDLSKKIKNNVLLNFDSEWLAGAKKYLKYYCQKYNVDLSELIPASVQNIKSEEYEYSCQCCDENLEGFSCRNGHLNMICSLTFTPIESDDYLSCKACGLIARKELLSENPMCVFCDVYLNSYFLPS